MNLEASSEIGRIVRARATASSPCRNRNGACRASLGGLPLRTCVPVMDQDPERGARRKRARVPLVARVC